MALQNNKSNYLKITKVNPYDKYLEYAVYRDQTMRDAVLDEFQKPIYTSMFFECDLNRPVDPTKTLDDNLKTFWYEFLKANGFSDAQKVQLEDELARLQGIVSAELAKETPDQDLVARWQAAIETTQSMLANVVVWTDTDLV